MDRRHFLKGAASTLPAVAAVKLADDYVESANTTIGQLWRAFQILKEDTDRIRAGLQARYEAREITASEMMHRGDIAYARLIGLFDQIADAPAVCEADLRAKAKALKTIFPHQYGQGLGPGSGAPAARAVASIISALTV